MIHLKLQITSEQEFILGWDEIWANWIWNKADPYTATGDNLVRKQAQASNSCSFVLKQLPCMHWKWQWKRGWGLTISPETLALSGLIRTRQQSGPWCDRSAAFIGFTGAIVGCTRWPGRCQWFGKVCRQQECADVKHRPACTVNTRHGCSDMLSQWENTHTHTYIK